MKTAIIGLGLIGGSFALSLKDKGLSDHIWGVEQSERNAQKALELGLVERICTLDEALAECKLIVLATTVDTIPKLAIKILNRIRPDQILMDMGATKQELCEMTMMHPNRGRLVASHPMWGTENSGPEAALHGAFKGRTVVICNCEQCDQDALLVVEDIYRELQMPILHMSAEDQDMHCAYISHISHITSFALALTVLEKEREEEHIFDLAGGGFESTVRLAKSLPQTWAPIFLENKYNVLDVLREHIHQLQILRRMIERDDREGLMEAMQRANKIREILK